MFGDQDDDITNGVQNESTTRKVDENTKANADDDSATDVPLTLPTTWAA